jgi:hypothetical protein
MLGCETTAQRTPAQEATRGAGLEAALAELSTAVDGGEARALARRALAATDALAERYRPIAPPLLGNLAFHIGLRERALCCHWVQDLFHELDPLPLRSLELHWGVAHHGSRLREHNSVIAVPIGGALGDGLVLDAWRHSGRLHWVRVSADVYPWRLHPADAERLYLECDS